MANKLTEERINLIKEGISEGLPKEIACNAAGISKNTFFRWLREGREDLAEGKETLQRKLLEDMPKIEADCELHHLRNIARHSDKHWEASAWYLERSRPGRYGRRVIQHVVNEDQDPDRIVVLGEAEVEEDEPKPKQVE